jgi:hypothetical protein
MSPAHGLASSVDERPQSLTFAVRMRFGCAASAPRSPSVAHEKTRKIARNFLAASLKRRTVTSLAPRPLLRLHFGEIGAKPTLFFAYLNAYYTIQYRSLARNCGTAVFRGTNATMRTVLSNFFRSSNTCNVNRLPKAHHALRKERFRSHCDRYEIETICVNVEWRCCPSSSPYC